MIEILVLTTNGIGVFLRGMLVFFNPILTSHTIVFSLMCNDGDIAHSSHGRFHTESTICSRFDRVHLWLLRRSVSIR
jgi:hypothetical protein